MAKKTKRIVMKAPAEISAEILNRAMKEFVVNWTAPENVEIEQQFLKSEAEHQAHLTTILSRVKFDLQKGTLIKIELGPETSDARLKWNLSRYRPDGLSEGDILMYIGWFHRSVKMFGIENAKNRNSSLSDSNKSSVSEHEPDLSEAFSTKIQLFIRSGKEEVWADIIPDLYYDILV